MNDDCCDPLVDVSHLRSRHRRILVIVLVINVATFAMMVVAAALSGSSSVLSGSLDNLGDALTYALSLAVVASAAAVQARVAVLKGVLILVAAAAVAVQIGWRLVDPSVPVVETMGLASAANLAANGVCLALLTPHRKDNINMHSVWECSRNDVYEGLAVIAAAAGVWFTQSGWPDLLAATILLALFLRSGIRLLREALRQARQPRRLTT